MRKPYFAGDWCVKWKGKLYRFPTDVEAWEFVESEENYV